MKLHWLPLVLVAGCHPAAPPSDPVEAQHEGQREAATIEDATEAEPAPTTEPPSADSTQQLVASDHWCFARGDDGKVVVTPCFDTEVNCKIIFAQSYEKEVFDTCHHRSPVYCYDVTRDGESLPECHARMEHCAGHWQVSRDYPAKGTTLGPGCTERYAPER